MLVFETLMKRKQGGQFVSMLAAVALILFTAGCATQTANVADVEVEQVLLTSGFKAKTARTPAQRAHLRTMPDNQFVTVQQDGNTYYLYADKKNDRLYAGDHWAYRSYQNYFKNKRLRQEGVFVREVNPADRANNQTVQVWHDWSPFRDWQ